MEGFALSNTFGSGRPHILGQKCFLLVDVASLRMIAGALFIDKRLCYKGRDRGDMNGCLVQLCLLESLKIA